MRETAPARFLADAGGRLEFLGRPVTAARLHERCEPLARSLRAAGIGPGDTLALLLPDSPGLIAASFAALRLGARPQLLDPSARAETLAARLAESGTDLLLTFDLQLLLDHSLALPQHRPRLRIGLLRFAEELPFPHNLLLPLMRGSGLGQRPPHPVYFRLPRGRGQLPAPPEREPRLLFSDGEASLAELLSEPAAQQSLPLHRRAGFAQMLRCLAEGGSRILAPRLSASSA